MSWLYKWSFWKKKKKVSGYNQSPAPSLPSNNSVVPNDSTLPSEEEQQMEQIKNLIRSDEIANHQLAAMFLQSLDLEWEKELFDLIGKSAEKMIFWIQQDIPDFCEYFKSLQITTRFFSQYNEVSEFAAVLPLFSHLEELNWQARHYWNQHPILSAAAKLPQLKRIYAENCKMNYIPEELCHATSLEELYLGSNRLHEIPSAVENLHSLKTLDLSNNHFTNSHPNLTKIKNLEVLSLAGNPLQDIEPRILGRLYRLKDLHLPPDIVRSYLDMLKGWLPDVDFNKHYWKVE